MKSLLIALSLVFVSAAANAELRTVGFVDVPKYLGRWYQIARNPLAFEPRLCPCAQQSLSLLPTGNVGVYNSCNAGSVTGPLTEIRGEAINDDPATNSKFTVDFHLPHKGKYWIIALADDYHWAVVSDPSELSLYILSKTPVLDEASYNEAVAQAAKQTDVSKLLTTSHAGCNYP